MLPRLVLVNNAASGGQARDDAHCSVWPHCWATQNAQDLQKRATALPGGRAYTDAVGRWDHAAARDAAALRW